MIYQLQKFESCVCFFNTPFRKLTTWLESPVLWLEVINFDTNIYIKQLTISTYK